MARITRKTRKALKLVARRVSEECSLNWWWTYAAEVERHFGYTRTGIELARRASSINGAGCSRQASRIAREVCQGKLAIFIR